MKRLFHTLLCVIFVVLSCHQPFAQEKNNDVLRILAIGNSFSDDAMEYLPALLENLEVNNVELARLYVGGCSLERHVAFHNKGEAPYIFNLSKAGENRWKEQKGTYSLKQVLTMGEWDIITLQQQSGAAGIYDSFEPYLGELIALIKQMQPRARIAWHMTWSYSANSNHNDYPRYDKNQLKMLQAIHSATSSAQKAHPEIEIIIPAGTAIQSLRNSAINNYPKDLTRDGYHMGFGAGRYVLACTWYEELIKPYTKISMAGNTLRINNGNIAVTPIIAAYCQKAAKIAAKKGFTVKKVKHIGRYLHKAEKRKSHKVIE